MIRPLPPLHVSIQLEILEMQMIAHCLESGDFNELDVKRALENKIIIISSLLRQIKEGE